MKFDLNLQWHSMNLIPFIDLFLDICLNSNLCTNEYYQHRLKDLGGNLEQYIQLIKRYSPSIAYVMTILSPTLSHTVQSNLIVLPDILYSDSTILEYLSRSSLLFTGYDICSQLTTQFYVDYIKLNPEICNHGIEWYIGFDKAGSRALKLHNLNYLEYLYEFDYLPNDLQGMLKVTYLESRDPVFNITSVSRDLSKLYGLFSSTQLYYPTTEPLYLAYEKGVKGEEFQTNDLFLPIAYAIGLIDGNHLQLFKSLYPPMDTIFRRSITRYVMAHGPYDFALFCIDIDSPDLDHQDMLELAVKGNNLPVVDLLLERYQLSDNDIYPRSVEMLNLLESYIKVDPVNVTIGGLQSGNYELLGYPTIYKPGRLMPLLHPGSTRYNYRFDSTINVLSVVVAGLIHDIPGYLLHLQLSLFPDENLAQALFKKYFLLYDFYHIEILLGLGYVAFPLITANIVNLIGVKNVNLIHYPKLRALVKA